MNNPHQGARLTLHSRELIVARHAAGRPVSRIAEEFGVSVRTVHKWLARHREGGRAALSNAASAPARRPGRLDDARVSKHYPTHVLRFGFRTYIILNHHDFHSKKPYWRAMVEHEKAHVRNHDVLYFAVFLIVGDAAGLYLVAVVGEVALFSVHRPENPISRGAAFLGIFGFIVLLIPLYNVFRWSLHDREFQADAYAFSIEPDARIGWLRSNRNKEVARSKIDYLKSGSWFSHPTFSSRLKALQSSRVPSPGPISKGFHSFYMFASGLLMALALTAASMFDVWGPMPLALPLASISFAAIILISAFGYLSYMLDRTLINEGIWKASVVAVVFCILMSILILTPSLLIYYEIIIPNPRRPFEPKSDLYEVIAEIPNALQISLVYCATSLFITTTLLRYRKFKALQYLVIGLISIAASFILFQYVYMIMN